MVPNPTKSALPRLRSAMVSRPGLLARLDEGRHRKLTVVCAGAGYGKTSLVSQWVTSGDRPVAWLTLDSQDADFGRFLSALARAVAPVGPDAGQAVAGLVPPGSRAEPSVLIEPLVQALGRIPSPFVLVFDDWHLVNAPWSAGLLQALLDNGPGLHLVVATREPLGIPLAVLRARDLVTEITGEDLRFSPTDASEFFRRVMGLSLSEAEESAVADRVGGWAAGLQLAALSLRSSRPWAAALDQTRRWAAELLVAEVLTRLDDEMRGFLLATCVTDRVCGPLAEALFPGALEGNLLGRAAAENLFLVPYGSEGWYCYHALFLQTLRDQAPQDHCDLHRRASLWFEAAGFEEEAFDHAARSGDLDRAASFVEGPAVPLHFRGAAALVRTWLEALPEPSLETRPGLRIIRAQTRLFGGQPRLAETDLAEAEAVLDRAPGTPENLNLRGRAESLRATLAILRHDPALRGHSERALALLAPAEVPLRTAARYTLGYALKLEKQDERALEAFDAVLSAAGPDDASIYTLAALVSQGQVYESLGDDRRASAAFSEAVRRAGEPPQRIACEAFLGLGRIAFRHHRPGAQALADRCRELTSDAEGTDTPVSWALLQAQIWASEGRAAEASAVLDTAEALALRYGFEFRLAELDQARRRLSPTGVDTLSSREVEVLGLAAEGLSNQQIADRLFLSPHTVKDHMKALLGKLGAANRTEAAARFRDANPPPNPSFGGGGPRG